MNWTYPAYGAVVSGLAGVIGFAMGEPKHGVVAVFSLAFGYVIGALVCVAAEASPRRRGKAP